MVGGAGEKNDEVDRKTLESAYLGQWLVDRGRISRTDLEAALSLCRERNRPVGDMALGRGLIDEAASQSILDAQRLRDRSWGELAVALGLLTAEGVNDLLEEQAKEAVWLGDALVELGVLSTDAVEECREEFHRHRAVFTVTPSDKSRQLLARSTLGTAFFDKFPRVVNRMSSGAISCFNDKAEVPTFEYRVHLGYRGDHSLQVELAAERALGAAMAEHILGLEPEDIDEEIIEDTLAETLNVVAGLAKEGLPAGESAQLGLPVKGTLDRPEVHFDFSTPFGRARLTFSDLGAKD